jgi:DNA-binding NarL/FixJ family response regulator
VLPSEHWAPNGELDGRLPAAERQLAVCLGSLTPAQFRVLTLVSSGLLNEQIAHELNISAATVKAHMGAVLCKLGVIARILAMRLAARRTLDPQAATATAAEQPT